MTATDLPKKLDALLGSGMTCKAISERVKCDISTNCQIRNDHLGNPGYLTGKAVDFMHDELVRLRMEDSSDACPPAAQGSQPEALAAKTRVAHVSLLQCANADNDARHLTNEHVCGVLLHTGDMGSTR